MSSQKAEGKVVVLDYPIADRSQLLIKRPKLKHLRGLKIKTAADGEAPLDIWELAEVGLKASDLPPALYDGVDYEDLLKVVDVVKDFLTAGSSPAPTN